MPPSSEAQARQQIDELLVAAGWAIQDYRAFHPAAGRGIALREVPLDSALKPCVRTERNMLSLPETIPP